MAKVMTGQLGALNLFRVALSGDIAPWQINAEAQQILGKRALRITVMGAALGGLGLAAYATHLSWLGQSLLTDYPGIVASSLVVSLAICALLVLLGRVQLGVLGANISTLFAAVAIAPASTFYLPAAFLLFSSSIAFASLFFKRRVAATLLIIEVLVLFGAPLLFIALNPLATAILGAQDHRYAALMLTGVVVVLFVYGGIDMHRWVTTTLTELQDAVTHLRQSAERMEQVRATLEIQVADSVAELRAERDFARQIMSTMSEGLCVVNLRDRKLEYANPAMARMQGFTADEMRGQPIHRFLSLEMQSLVMEDATGAGNGPTLAATSTLQITPRDSTAPIFVQASVAAVRDRHTGDVSRKLLVLTNVTGQLQAQETLRRQKAQLEALHATSLDLVTRLDVRDLLQNLLNRACDLVGTEHGFLDLVTADGNHLQTFLQSGLLQDGAPDVRPIHAGLGGHAAVTQETLSTSDYRQHQLALNIRARNIMHAAVFAPMVTRGHTLGVLAVAHTEPGRLISESEVALVDRLAKLGAIALEKARLYEQVQFERDFARTIMDNVGQPVAVTGPDGLLEYVNNAVEPVLGYAPAEMRGRGAWRFFDAGNRKQLYARFKSGDPASFEVTVRSKSGASVPLLFSVVPRVPGDPRSGMIGLFTDLSAIKATEQALRDARDKAQAASRLKSQFLAMLSHEIRTPLNAIMGMTELVLDTPLDAEQREMLGVAHESSESLMHMINDMLDFSRIEAGKLTLNNAEFDVTDLITNTCAMFQKRAIERGIYMSCNVGSGLPRKIMGDAVRLRQVLVNLLGNAFKFTEAGGVTLRVCQEAGDAGAPQLRFEVQDTGIGMEPAVVAGLFHPFQQGDATSTRRFGGTGLGLSICKALVEMMGGRITVSSAPGTGSLFAFTVPLQQTATPATN